MASFGSRRRFFILPKRRRREEGEGKRKVKPGREKGEGKKGWGSITAAAEEKPGFRVFLGASTTVPTSRRGVVRLRIFFFAQTAIVEEVEEGEGKGKNVDHMAQEDFRCEEQNRFPKHIR